MKFRLGQTYYGCSSEDGPCLNDPRFVVECPNPAEFEPGMVYYQTPHGLGEVFKAPEDEFETWRSRSERRTYIDADGVRKTRLGFILIMPDEAPVEIPASEVSKFAVAGDDTEDGEDKPPKPMILVEVTEVGSATLETPKLAEWLEWRETAQ